MKDLTVKFNLADDEYLTALRLVAGAVCTAREADVDTMEDIKVCITESALILKNSGFESVEATFCGDGTIYVLGIGGSPEEGDNDLSVALISALFEDCQFIVRRGGIIEKVILKV